ncbi:MAG: hypothetical protein ACK5LT_06515, partial [Lachnospirales bacterium]
MIDTLLIIQHNVLNWSTNKHSLINYYLQEVPDVILINSHGLKSDQFLKIPGYKTYKINASESLADGSAIALKYNITLKLYDDFETDALTVEIQTTLGPIIIATTYLLPRKPYVPFPDFYRLLNNDIPTYILGDFNARHSYFGNNSENMVGKSFMQLINQGIMIHIGPHFPTYLSHGAATNPDKILANKHHCLNINTEPGEITSDHIPIKFTLATKPFIIPQPKVYRLNKADWDAFQAVPEHKIEVKELDNCSTNEIETEVKNCIDTIKEAMEKYIPKSEHK